MAIIFVKLKVLKIVKKISFDAMKSLLNEGASLNLNHIKWFRSLEDANITLKSSKYQLTPTQNKRFLVYENGVAVSTIPIKLNN